MNSKIDKLKFELEILIKQWDKEETCGFFCPDTIKTLAQYLAKNLIKREQCREYKAGFEDAFKRLLKERKLK